MIVPSAQTDLLLPERIFPNDKRPYPLFYQKINNAFTGSMKIMIDLSIALGGNPLHLLCGSPSVLFGKALLQFFHTLVVPLIDGFERPTVNQSRV